MYLAVRVGQKSIGALVLQHPDPINTVLLLTGCLLHVGRVSAVPWNGGRKEEAAVKRTRNGLVLHCRINEIPCVDALRVLIGISANATVLPDDATERLAALFGTFLRVGEDQAWLAYATKDHGEADYSRYGEFFHG